MGKSKYVPIIPDAAYIALALDNEEMQTTLKKASVIFGDIFLVTYLAGRYLTAKRSEPHYLVYYTVNDKPFLKERLLFGKKNQAAFDLQNQLACRTLHALHDFPKNFPTLWQQLKKREEQNRKKEVFSYEIH